LTKDIPNQKEVRDAEKKHVKPGIRKRGFTMEKRSWLILTVLMILSCQSVSSIRYELQTSDFTIHDQKRNADITIGMETVTFTQIFGDPQAYYLATNTRLSFKDGRLASVEWNNMTTDYLFPRGIEADSSPDTTEIRWGAPTVILTEKELEIPGQLVQLFIFRGDTFRLMSGPEYGNYQKYAPLAHHGLYVVKYVFLDGKLVKASITSTMGSLE
jgi:hypothetical protein